MYQWFWHIYEPMHNQVLVYILCSLYWIQTKISNVNPMIVIWDINPKRKYRISIWAENVAGEAALHLVIPNS